jgi:AP-4 complex subunit epsilon-1
LYSYYYTYKCIGLNETKFVGILLLVTVLRKISAKREVNKSSMATGGVNLSREFFELLKAVGESKSKQEEDRIIAKEVQRLKQKLEPIPINSQTPGPLSSKKQAKEFLVRLLYVEMLGHDGSFGYIKAVEMAASASLFHKRTGYLVCGACLPPDHEFRFMLVNQMQRDLQSANVLECSGGLLACTNLITPDMVPAVHTEVTKLIHHDSATIRKKAIIALHRFHQLAPEVTTAEELHELLRKVLCDKDPSVMGSSLNVIQTMSNIDPKPFKDLVPSLVSILKQICDHRLPSDYDYHRVPAPWMQLKLVRILGILGRADRDTSNGMYEILNDTLKKADAGINAGYAIIYECVKTIVQIYPNTALLDGAAEAIARFIDSRSHNLKYLGVTGLAMIVETHPQYAAQHQLAVMDCLEDTDETLQRKTLDLLYRMTNPVNVEFISEKLIHFLQGTTDPFLKKQLTVRVCNIAEKYAPNNTWYIQTITKLFEVSGDMVNSVVAQNLMSLLAEGTGESEEDDMLLRQNAVELYVTILNTKPLGSVPKILVQTMAWCLGEYGYLSVASPIEDVLARLCQLATVHKAKLGGTTRKFLISAIMKLVAQAGTCPPAAAAVINDYTKSKDIDLQQRCLEFQAILTICPTLLPEILPVDASAEDVDVDINLSFLDGYVQQKLAEGMQPYSVPEDYGEDDDDDDYGGALASVGSSGFKMTPYEKPTQPSSLAMMNMGSMGSTSAGRVISSSTVPLPPGAAPSTSMPVGGPTMAAAANAPPPALGLNTRNVANVWGKGGVQGAGAAPAPPPPPAATAVSGAPASNVWASHAPSSSAYGDSTSGGYGGSVPPPSPAPVVKSAAQLEKERAAAALFGGMIPGATPPPPPTPVVTPAVRSAARAVAAAPVAAAPLIATPAPPPAPAAEFDLLDMGAWDDTPATGPASTNAPAVDYNDAFGAATLLQPTQSVPAPHEVETVSDDEQDVGLMNSTAASSTPVPVAPAVDVDPFASAGLLGDISEKPLPTLAQSQKFEFNGKAMAPLAITTAQFGQNWGSCPATVPISVLSSSSVTTLTQFMETCSKCGLHKIEAIAATNEGICAGMVGASTVVLIHGKVIPSAAGTRVDVTVKTTDQQLATVLAMYLQTMLR